MATLRHVSLCSSAPHYSGVCVINHTCRWCLRTQNFPIKTNFPLVLYSNYWRKKIKFPTNTFRTVRHFLQVCSRSPLISLLVWSSTLHHRGHHSLQHLFIVELPIIPTCNYSECCSTTQHPTVGPSLIKTTDHWIAIQLLNNLLFQPIIHKPGNKPTLHLTTVTL